MTGSSGHTAESRALGPETHTDHGTQVRPQILFPTADAVKWCPDLSGSWTDALFPLPALLEQPNTCIFSGVYLKSVS